MSERMKTHCHKSAEVCKLAEIEVSWCRHWRQRRGSAISKFMKTML